MKMRSKIEKLKEGEKAAGISGSVILVLALLKVLIGLFSGSLILISDALHSFADFVVMLTSWFGLRISQKKPTEKFPYGFYKSENIATLFISIFILLGAVELLKEGYFKLFSISVLSLPFYCLLVALISIITSYFLANYLSRIGKRINAQSLVVSSKEKLLDVFSSIIVFIGILLSIYQVPYVEGIFTIAISIMVLKVGIFSMKDSIFALMDITPSEDLVKKIERTISSIQGVEEFRGLKLRKSGPFIFGEVKVKVKKGINVEKAHEIADHIEKKIADEVEEVDSFTIHIEPHEKKIIKVAIPIALDKGLSSPLMEHFGRAKNFLFAILDKEKKKIEAFYVKSNPFMLERVKAGLSVVNFLLKEKIDTVLTKEIGEISFHTLRDNLVEIYKTEGKTVKEIIDDFFDGKLNKLEKPTRKEEETIERRWGRRGKGPWWGR